MPARATRPTTTGMAEPATRDAAPRLRFSKMHGAGNDFVVLDLRHGAPPPSPEQCRALADRHRGVGCDQILTIEAPRSVGALAAYGIWNSDGSRAAQCGNGARCVAAWLLRDGAVGAGPSDAGSAGLVLDSPAGSHVVDVLGTDRFRISMGRPQFDPSGIPLRVAAPAPRYRAQGEGMDVEFAAVSMGNPHAVVVVPDVARAPVAQAGAWLQSQPLFPDSVNVGFVEVVSRRHVRLRVYERGAGETLACGSGACAAAAVLMRDGVVDRDVRVSLPGGELQIDWPDDQAPLAMAGPATFVFEGEWLQ